MNPTLPMATLSEARERKTQTAPNRAPASAASTSLIVVMIVYVLFGFVGFYAAAQVAML